MPPYMMAYIINFAKLFFGIALVILSCPIFNTFVLPEFPKRAFIWITLWEDYPYCPIALIRILRDF